MTVDVKARYTTMAKTRHPDMPSGSTAAMAELNLAYEAALKELGR